MPQPDRSSQAANRHANMVLATDRPPLDISQLRFDYDQVALEHRQQVIEAAVQIRADAERAQASIIQIGQRLLEVKTLLPHGQFSDWIGTEFNLSQRMATNMMNVAREYGGKSEIISVLNDTVLYLLAAPSTPEEVRQEVEQAAASGQKVTVEFAKEVIRKAKPKPEPPGMTLDQAIAFVWQQIKEYVIRGEDTFRLNWLKVQDRQFWLKQSGAEWDVLEPALARVQAELEGRIEHAKRTEQRQATARQAQDNARVVYVEPEPMPTDLAAAGYTLRQAGFGDRTSWAAALRLGEGTGYLGLWRSDREQAIEDAREHMRRVDAQQRADEQAVIAEVIELNDPRASWPYKVLVNPTARKSDFISALNAASKEIILAAFQDYPVDARLNKYDDALGARLQRLGVRPTRDEPVEADIDEATAIAEVAAELAEEDAERLARDATRAPAERAVQSIPDDRLIKAKSLITALINTREQVRADYGDLTGRHTDTLKFERDVAVLLEPLTSLVEVLTQGDGDAT